VVLLATYSICLSPVAKAAERTAPLTSGFLFGQRKIQQRIFLGWETVIRFANDLQDEIQ
jgi:hypothetical protein